MAAAHPSDATRPPRPPDYARQVGDVHGSGGRRRGAPPRWSEGVALTPPWQDGGRRTGRRAAAADPSEMHVPAATPPPPSPDLHPRHRPGAGLLAAYLLSVAWQAPFLRDVNGYALGRDFLNAWVYGRGLERRGRALLRHPPHNQHLAALTGWDYPAQQWSYAPHFMLVMAPFGLMPYLPALALWTALSLLALLVVVPVTADRRFAWPVLVLAPAGVLLDLRAGLLPPPGAPDRHLAQPRPAAAAGRHAARPAHRQAAARPALSADAGPHRALARRLRRCGDDPGPGRRHRPALGRRSLAALPHRRRADAGAGAEPAHQCQLCLHADALHERPPPRRLLGPRLRACRVLAALAAAGAVAWTLSAPARPAALLRGAGWSPASSPRPI